MFSAVSDSSTPIKSPRILAFYIFGYRVQVQRFSPTAIVIRSRLVHSKLRLLDGSLVGGGDWLEF